MSARAEAAERAAPRKAFLCYPARMRNPRSMLVAALLTAPVTAAAAADVTVSVAGAAAFTVATLLGVNRGWSPETHAALAIGGAGQTLVAVGLAVRVATLSEKRKLLFVPGALGAAVIGVVQLLIATLGGA